MVLLLSALFLAQDSVPLLIEKLGSDSVEERDEASRELRLRVYEAQEALVGATRNADPEIAHRAGEILGPLAKYRTEAAVELFLLLHHARSEFEAGHFDHCARICDLAHYLAPGLRAVEELRWDALGGGPSFVCKDLGQWIDPAWIRLPGPDRWRRLRNRIRRCYPDDDWEENAVQRGLSGLRVTLSFRNATVEEVLDALRDLAGLPIAVEDAAREKVDVERRLSFDARDESLSDVLSTLAERLGLRCVVTEERVVLLSFHEGLREVFRLDDRDPDRY